MRIHGLQEIFLLRYGDQQPSGQTEITAELSKTGFRQQRREADPYFIILAASLLQCLLGKHLLRPSGIHRRGILGIVESGSSRWSVISKKITSRYSAAPPEKINSIGQFIDSVGRQPDRDRTVYTVR